MYNSYGLIPYGHGEISFIICRCTYGQGLLSVHCVLVFQCILHGFDRIMWYFLGMCGINKYSLEMCATLNYMGHVAMGCYVTLL